jgi:hypothetical protein
VESHNRINKYVYSKDKNMQEEKHSINKTYIKHSGEKELSSSDSLGNRDTYGKLHRDYNNSGRRRSTYQKCPGDSESIPHVCEEHPTHTLSSPVPGSPRTLHDPVPTPSESPSKSVELQLSSPDSFPYGELPGTTSSSLSSALLHSPVEGDRSSRAGRDSDSETDSSSDSEEEGEEGGLETRGDSEGLKSRTLRLGAIRRPNPEAEDSPLGTGLSPVM